jgi:hypothetical protein
LIGAERVDFISIPVRDKDTPPGAIAIRSLP